VFVWIIFYLYYRHCLHAQLDLTRDTHFLLIVIVNSAASFALDAHHCTNITGSRGKELHRAGHRKKSAFTDTPFPFLIAIVLSSHGFTRMVFRLGWAGLTAFSWVFLFLVILGLLLRLTVLDLGAL
jgi:hypothetical protein